MFSCLAGLHVAYGKMNEIITITIDKEVLLVLWKVLIVFAIVFMILMTIDMIITEIKRKKKQAFLNKCKPYEKQYKELHDQRKYKEAKDYWDKNKHYLKHCYYYA